MNLLRILGFGQRKVETIGLEVPAWKREHPEWNHDRSAAGRKAMATCERKYGGQPESYASRIARKGGEATARKRRAA